jgi:hypothetical protein
MVYTANTKKSKGWWFLSIAFICIIAISVAYTIISSCDWNIQSATLAAISLTLIALIIYATDTHSVASINKSRWELENVCRAFYSMYPHKDDPDNIRFGIINESILVMRAKVNCNFKICGEDVEYSDDYNGRNTWYIFPRQKSEGHFEISKLLSKKGKSVQDMIEERTEANREEQLTMDLEIKFKDEHENSRDLPSRIHFYDFKVNTWIPIIAWKDDWQD